ncbi:MAG: dockerin type I repeat-containing protein [Candidatus Zixiibacteriota bacterium]
MRRRLLSLWGIRFRSCVAELTTVLLFLLVGSAWGQEIIWSKTYGGLGEDGGLGGCQTSEGGYIVTGITLSYGSGAQVYLIKTDRRGDTLWARTYGGAGWDQGNSVRQTSDGGYIVAGWTDSFGSAIQVYLIKTDSGGDTIWTRTYGGADWENGVEVRQTRDRGYAIVGSKRIRPRIWDVYLIKTDSTGGLQWSRTYGGNRNDKGYSVEQTRDGGYIIAGYYGCAGYPDYSVYLIKTDPGGDTLWTRTYYPEGSWWSLGLDCALTWDGGYIVTGFSIDQAIDQDVYLIKTDAEGDTIWTRTYGGNNWESGAAVRPTYDGGYILAGVSQDSASGSNRIYLIKTDGEGDTLWTRIYGGSGGDSPYEVLLASDGGYLVVGATSSYGAGSADMYLLKISAFPEAILAGDANGNGEVNVGDVVYLINYLLKQGPSPELPAGSDNNCDQAVNLEDVVYLLNYLFRNGPVPGYECA